MDQLTLTWPSLLAVSAQLVVVSRTQPLPQADIKSYMQMLLRGLDHCHKCFFLHRVSTALWVAGCLVHALTIDPQYTPGQDLKTNNLMLGDDGQLKLIDFGMARAFGSPHHKLNHQVVTMYVLPVACTFGHSYSNVTRIAVGIEHRSCCLVLESTTSGWTCGLSGECATPPYGCLAAFRLLCLTYCLLLGLLACRCIMAELMRRDAFFKGTSELDQLSKIFDKLGTPTTTDWPVKHNSQLCVQVVSSLTHASSRPPTRVWTSFPVT